MNLKLRLIIIYIGYWSTVYSLQWNIESTSKLDSEGVSPPMGPNGPRFELLDHDDMFYEDELALVSFLCVREFW